MKTRGALFSDLLVVQKKIAVNIRAGPAVKLTFRVPAIKFEPLGAQCY